MKKIVSWILISVILTSLPMTASAALCKGSSAAENSLSDELRQEIDRYNYVIGTNAFAPGYQFTEKDPLIELSDAIVAWGSNMIKFNAGSDDGLVDRVLEGRDFDYVFMWYRSEAYFRDGYSEAEARADYDAIYAFTQKLLRTYNGTGKQFFIGHWEGDWYYLGGYNGDLEKVDDAITEGMTEWIKNRQRAVDDAKRDTPHDDVCVWNYLELNRPFDALDKGYDRVVNRVLPYTDVDYVSYSAYDSLNKSTRTIRKTIDYIYENLPEKSGVPGPRVFIGEAAIPASRYDFNDRRHCDANIRMMAKFLQCDVGFCLYWEMYCNEKLEDGRSRGFWLIDSDGNKTRLYRELQTVIADGKEYVEKFAEEHGRVPDAEEYRCFLLRRPVFVKARIAVFFEDIAELFRSAAEKVGSIFRTPDGNAA